MKTKLRVIAGHGGQDPGAVVGDKVERELNAQAVLAFNDAASREWMPHDVTIVIIPASDPRGGDATLQAKIDDANAAGADQLLIEVHHNIGAADSGCQLWYSQNAKTTPGDETWNVLPHLAREIGFLIGAPVPQLSSDHSRFGKLGILDDTVCTAILIEARNVGPLDTPDWEYSFGVALARAMATYFGWPPAHASAPAPVPPPVDAKLAQAKAIVADAAAKVAAL